MENVSIYEKMSARRKVKQSQRAWKYLRDLNSLDLSDLNRTALIAGDRKYTYGSMFHEWERYASVFTALGMTELEHARVGIVGSTNAEIIFSYYALNMVGAEVSLLAGYMVFNSSRIKETIRQEHLTDIIIPDDLAQQDLVRELLLKRKELGLRHVILLHVPVSGPTVHPMMTAAHEAKHASLKALYRPICMETLLEAFGSHPVHYSMKEDDDTAFILHTTGTTSGVGKPVPLSDNALNAAVLRFFKLEDLVLPYDNLVTALIVDSSNSYGMVDQVHLPFAMGATVVMIPLGLLNPQFYKALGHYRISFLFCITSVIDRWMKMPENTDFDFSSLKFVALGGTAVSSADKKRYHEFIEAHGGKDVVILNGYGLTELGGACCLSSPDLDDESIGVPMPGINIILYDEEKESFFTPGGDHNEGVLYLNALSMATPKLDGEDVVKVQVIDRKAYICTNDLVRVDEDGRITYLGRANRYFIREEGRKYESGRVETEFSRWEDIEACAIVPVYVKMEHENLPMLCVKTLDTAAAPEDVVLDTFRQVFITEKTLPEDYIPCRVMLVESFPLNVNGKLDLFKLNRGQISGDTYDVEQVREEGRLTGFTLTPSQEETADVIEQIYDDIRSDIKADLKEDIKGKLPLNIFNQKMQKENPTMDNNKLFENFNSMAMMHQQMLNNMQGMMGQRFPAFSQFAPFAQAPEMKSMQEMMPNMESVMPEMQKMANTMQGMLPNIPGILGGIAQAVLPVFHQQAVQRFSNMNKMNQMIYETGQRFNEQKNEINQKWYELAMKMVNADPRQAQPEAADTEETQEQSVNQ